MCARCVKIKMSGRNWQLIMLLRVAAEGPYNVNTVLGEKMRGRADSTVGMG